MSDVVVIFRGGCVYLFNQSVFRLQFSRRHASLCGCMLQVFHFSESKEKDDEDAQENKTASEQSDDIGAKPLTQSKKIS